MTDFTQSTTSTTSNKPSRQIRFTICGVFFQAAVWEPKPVADASKQYLVDQHKIQTFLFSGSLEKVTEFIKKFGLEFLDVKDESAPSISKYNEALNFIDSN